jgi:DNA-binding transcriptional MerR regulator
MPDYLLSEHLATQLGLSRDELRSFEEWRVIDGVEKNGAIYYSSRDFYKLKGVLHFTREKGLSLDEAKDRVMNPFSLASTSDH